MSASTSNTVFKAPPSPSRLKRPAKKVKVMDEDEYVDKVSEIIQRDFFPELEKYEARSEFLDASDRNDVGAMARLRERFSTSSRVGHQGRRVGTPDTFETPMRERSEDAPEAQPGDGEHDAVENKRKLGLDQFMSSHTSEDNSSFDEIMEESRKKFKLDHAWMFKEDEVLSLEDKRNQLALPSIEMQNEKASQDVGKSKKLDGWTYKNVNSVFYNPDGVALTAEEEIERAKKEKKIVIENTRFQKNPWKSELQDHSLKATAHDKLEKEAGKVGVDGKEVTRPETPSVNGFKFLRMTPSPMPGALGDESPMMTWGEVESTPYRLEGCDTPLPMNTSGEGPSFSIQQMPKRDRIAHELAEKNSKFYRDKKNKAIQKARSNIKTPTMNMTQRVASMSPAAQRLATNKLGVRIGTDNALRASYTPSPMRPSSSSSSLSTPKLKAKEKISSSIRSRGSATPKTPNIISSDLSSLTDNLLNLPKSVGKTNASLSRPKASDFL